MDAAVDGSGLVVGVGKSVGAVDGVKQSAVADDAHVFISVDVGVRLAFRFKQAAVFDVDDVVNVNCRLVGPFRMSFQLFGHVGQTALRHFVDEGFDISLVNARHFQHHVLELRIFFDEAFDVFLFGAGTDGNLFSASVFIGQRVAVFVPGLKQLGKTKPPFARHNG